MNSSGELFLRSQEGYFGVYLQSCEVALYSSELALWAQ